jgi:hypothetical protein
MRMKRSRCLSAPRLRPLPALLAELAYLKALAENERMGMGIRRVHGHGGPPA